MVDSKVKMHQLNLSIEISEDMFKELSDPDSNMRISICRWLADEFKEAALQEFAQRFEIPNL